MRVLQERSPTAWRVYFFSRLYGDLEPYQQLLGRSPKHPRQQPTVLPDQHELLAFPFAFRKGQPGPKTHLPVGQLDT